MLKFTEWSKTPGITLKKHTEGKKTLFLKEISYFLLISLLIWMKETLTWFSLQKNEAGNGFSNIKDTFAESLQLQMLGLHQSRVHQGWSIKFK